ncbi:MAG: ABC transporter permease subunit, partial [Candidatus Hodarchaeota archaeon]
MQWSLIWLLIKKDWADTFRSKQILATLILIPILMGLVIPVSFIAPFSLIPEDPNETSELSSLAEIFPPLTPDWDQFSDKAKIMYLFIIFAHLFFLMVPIIVSSTVSSDTIVGEKERDTIEGLLSLPLSTSELILGKILSSLLPGLFATWAVSVPYIVVIDYFMFPEIGRLLLPDLTFILLIAFLTPLLSFIAVTVTIMISSRTATTRDAQQLSVFFLLPIIFLVAGQLFIILFDIRLILVGIVVLSIACYITFKIATKIFKGEKDLKGVIIGGPGPLKEKFKGGECLDYQLRKKVLGVV